MKTKTSQTKTSQTHPLEVDFIQGLALPGGLGLTFAPGKKDVSRFGWIWERDLDSDIDRLVERYRIDVLVSLLEAYEYQVLQIPDLFERLATRGVRVRHLPIKDVWIPGNEQRQAFEELVREMVTDLEAGKAVVAHCRGGLGRAGMTAACVLVACGSEPDEAIGTVRKYRKGAIQTREQEQYVREFRLLTGTA